MKIKGMDFQFIRNRIIIETATKYIAVTLNTPNLKDDFKSLDNVTAFYLKAVKQEMVKKR